MVTSVKNLVKCVSLWNFLVVFIYSFFTFVIILVMLKSIIFLFDLLCAIVSSWDLNQIWSLFVVHHWNLDVCFWVSYKAVPNWLSIYLFEKRFISSTKFLLLFLFFFLSRSLKFLDKILRYWFCFLFPPSWKKKEQKRLIYPAAGSSSKFGFKHFFFWEKVCFEKC